MNRKNKLKNCLDSIWQNSYKNIELIVIDNHSSDGTVSFLSKLKNECANIKIIFNQVNLGLAKARNQGIENSKGKYILFIDDDNVIDKLMIDNLLSLFKEDQKIGIIAPKTYYRDNPRKIWFNGANINLLTSKANFKDFNLIENNNNNYNFQVNLVHNCFIVKNELFKKIGMFDEDLFLGYIEFDVCMRVNRNYSIYICSNAKSYHDIPSKQEDKSLRYYGLDTPFDVYYRMRNRGIIIKRYSNSFQKTIFFLIFYPLYFVYYSWIILKYKKSDYLKFHLKGTLAGLNYFLLNRLKELKI